MSYKRNRYIPRPHSLFYHVVIYVKSKMWNLILKYFVVSKCTLGIIWKWIGLIEALVQSTHTNIELGNNLVYLRKPFNFDVHSLQISSWSTTEKCFFYKRKFLLSKIFCVEFLVQAGSQVTIHLVELWGYWKAHRCILILLEHPASITQCVWQYWLEWITELVILLCEINNEIWNIKVPIHIS